MWQWLERIKHFSKCMDWDEYFYYDNLVFQNEIKLIVKLTNP